VGKNSEKLTEYTIRLVNQFLDFKNKIIEEEFPDVENFQLAMHTISQAALTFMIVDHLADFDKKAHFRIMKVLIEEIEELRKELE
jgi:hypothetical protein